MRLGSRRVMPWLPYAGTVRYSNILNPRNLLALAGTGFWWATAGKADAEGIEVTICTTNYGGGMSISSMYILHGILGFCN